MKVSIIVPVYNAAPYLEKCLDSLACQTLEDFELILINDGSKDNSWDIIEDYRSRYPELIISRSVENGGQGRARNIGIDLASGDYIGFVDSDDWVDTRMYEKLLKVALEEAADIVVCDIEEHRSDGSVRTVCFTDMNNLMTAGGSACNKLFKRSFVGDTRFPVGVWYEDFEFSTKLIMKDCKVAALHEAPYFYRIGDGTTMNNKNTAKNLDIITVMENIRAAAGGVQDARFNELILDHILLEAIKRVELQTSEEKTRVISALREYVRKYIPNLKACPEFKKQPFNTKLIMWLNYNGMSALSIKILNLKNTLRRNP